MIKTRSATSNRETIRMKGIETKGIQTKGIDPNGKAPLIPVASSSATQSFAEQQRFQHLESQLSNSQQVASAPCSDLERWIDEYLEIGLSLASTDQPNRQAVWLSRIQQTFSGLISQQSTVSVTRQLCQDCLAQVVFALSHLTGNNLRQRSLLAYHQNAVSCRQIH